MNNKLKALGSICATAALLMYIIPEDNETISTVDNVPVVEESQTTIGATITRLSPVEYCLNATINEKDSCVKEADNLYETINFLYVQYADELGLSLQTSPENWSCEVSNLVQGYVDQNNIRKNFDLEERTIPVFEDLSSKLNDYQTE